MSFEPEFTLPATESDRSLWFIFHKGKLLTKAGGEGQLIPRSRDLANADISPIHKHYLGKLDGLPCYAAVLADNHISSDGFEIEDLRRLFGRLEEELIWVAGRANQLVDWSQSHQFCGRCGHATENKQDERAKICPQCSLVNYPRVSPAIIVAVIKDHQILLGSNRRFKGGFYSVLAGFAEPGESLEECVAREVNEEVGIAVKNIRYFGSQPWPFPNSLMVGFIADYAGGRINVNPSEIVEAAWYSAQDLPKIPPKISIARQLIDWFVDNHSMPHSQRTDSEWRPKC
jgi:NAD+ diphosphatase